MAEKNNLTILNVDEDKEDWNGHKLLLGMQNSVSA